MTWPPTFPAGSVLTSGQLTNLISPPACRAYDGVGISITTSGTPQVVTLSAETYDFGPSPMHSTSTNTSRLVAPYTGKYDFVAAAAFAAHADTAERYIAVRKNAGGSFSGGTAMGSIAVPAVSGVGMPLRLVDIGVPLAAGDYLEMFVVQSSGGALNLTAGDGITYFELNGAAA